MTFENFYFTLFFVFVFGTIIGSFLNVVIFRFNTGAKIANDRSKCFSCGTELKWQNLVPLLSWIFQKGKCAYCKSKISIQYPLVEFSTGALFVILFLKAYLPNLFFLNLNLDVSAVFSNFDKAIYNLTNLYEFSTFAIIFSVYIVILAYDFRHKIIPDELSFGLAGFVFIFQILNIFIYKAEIDASTFLNLFAGLILALPFYLLWKISEGRWIGLGDAKLALSIGTLLGLFYGFSAIIFSFYIGALFSVAIMLIQRLISHKQKITIKSEIPFGPFMIIATLIVFLFQINIFNIGVFI